METERHTQSRFFRERSIDSIRMSGVTLVLFDESRKNVHQRGQLLSRLPQSRSCQLISVIKTHTRLGSAYLPNLPTFFAHLAITNSTQFGFIDRAEGLIR